MRVLEEGIPGWYEKGYPVEGRRVGVFEHRPYPETARLFERRQRRASR